VQIVDLVRVDEPFSDKHVESFHGSHELLDLEFISLQRTISQSINRFVEFAQRFIDLEQEWRCRCFAGEFQLLACVEQSGSRDEHGGGCRHIGNDGYPLGRSHW
jgi:hypothetical protein